MSKRTQVVYLIKLRQIKKPFIILKRQLIKNAKMCYAPKNKKIKKAHTSYLKCTKLLIIRLPFELKLRRSKRRIETSMQEAPRSHNPKNLNLLTVIRECTNKKDFHSFDLKI